MNERSTVEHLTRLFHSVTEAEHIVEDFGVVGELRFVDSEEKFGGRAFLLPGAKVCGQDNITVREPKPSRGLANDWLLYGEVFRVHGVSR